jgi:hypothetical protein
MTDEAPRDSQRAGRREWIGLAVIALPCLLYSTTGPRRPASPAMEEVGGTPLSSVEM